MAHRPAFDPIRYLVGRRYPDADRTIDTVVRIEKARIATMLNVSQTHPTVARPRSATPTARDFNARRQEIEHYRQSLERLPPEQIHQLVADEQEKHRIEIETRVQAEEARRFFNLPGAEADFDHYCKCANWSLDEAVALSFGKEPKVVNWRSVSPYVQVSAFAKQYAKRRDLAARAQWAQQLFDPVFPSIFLSWAKTRFPLPERLMTASIDNGLSLKSWKDLYEDAHQSWRDQMSALKNKHADEIAALRSELATYSHLIEQMAEAAKASAPDPQPLGTRERENLQMLALVGALRGYGYDPEMKTKAVKRIEDDLDRLGHQLRDDRIRFHLQQAALTLRPGWRECISLKPNTGSR